MLLDIFTRNTPMSTTGREKQTAKVSTATVWETGLVSSAQTRQPYRMMPPSSSRATQMEATTHTLTSAGCCNLIANLGSYLMIFLHRRD